jgi:hypothetical protein
MPEPTKPTSPTNSIKASAAAAVGQAASVRRVIAEAARGDPNHAGLLVPVTLARVALAEATGLLPRRPTPTTATATSAHPADQHQHPAKGTADEHDHRHQHDCRR